MRDERPLSEQFVDVLTYLTSPKIKKIDISLQAYKDTDDVVILTSKLEAIKLEIDNLKIKLDTAKFALRKISDVTSGYEMREYEMRDYAKLMLEKLDVK